MYLTDDELEEIISKTLGNKVDESKSVPHYPLTNISTDIEGTLFFEIACPGFKREEITIERVKGLGLVITGILEDDELDEEYDYYQKHFNLKNFERKLVLSKEYVRSEVQASYDDGILTIILEKRFEEDNPEREIIEF